MGMPPPPMAMPPPGMYPGMPPPGMPPPGMPPPGMPFYPPPHMGPAMLGLPPMPSPRRGGDRRDGRDGRDGRDRGRKGDGRGDPHGDRARSVLSGQMQKTKLCDFHREGRCRYGSGCAFAHSEEELKTLPDLRKTRICRAFTQGKCRDPDCKFAHGQEELRQTDAAKKLEDGGPAPEGGGNTPGPNARSKRRARQKARKAAGGSDNAGDDGEAGSRSQSPENDSDVSESEEEPVSKRPRVGCVSSALCPRCGSTIANHLGYALCSICRS